MTGHCHLMRTGLPVSELCFTGVRNGGEMKIDLLWTESRSACDDGKLLPMAGKKWPTERWTVLGSPRKNALLPAAKCQPTAVVVVTFGEQSRVISRECEGLSKSGNETA